MPFVIGQPRPAPTRTILGELTSILDAGVNLVFDPRFESGARRVFVDDAVYSPLTAVVTAPTIEGGYSLQVAAGDLAHVLEIPWTQAQGPLCFAADVGFCTATGLIGAVFYDVNGDVLEAEQSQVQGLAIQTATLICTPPMLTASVECYCQANGLGTASFDRLIVTPSATPVDFFDGDSGGCAWTGKRWYSVSERFGQALDLPFMIRQGGPYWSSDSALVPQ
jgi:hypothetical protein